MGYDLKDYKEVSERIIDLRQKYPDASLQSEVILWPTEALPFIAVKALCYRTRKDENPGVGLAWEPFPGKTPYTRDSELQNAETSAWGRAIVAALASDTKQGVASADEVRNRRAEPTRTAGSRDGGAGATQRTSPASAPSPSSEADEANTATPSAPTSTSAPDTAEGATKGEGEAPEVAPKATPEQFDRLTRLYDGRVKLIRASGVKKLSEITFAQAEALILAKASA
jgi:hypothetical protein